MIVYILEYYHICILSKKMFGLNCIREVKGFEVYDYKLFCSRWLYAGTYTYKIQKKIRKIINLP